MGKEIDKLNKIKDKSQNIGLFLEWLSNSGITLCEGHEHNEWCKDSDGDDYCGYNEGQYIPTMKKIEEILAIYFKIDLKKVEEEKQKILKSLSSNLKDGK